jgi:hypothetical protein
MFLGEESMPFTAYIRTAIARVTIAGPSSKFIILVLA